MSTYPGDDTGLPDPPWSEGTPADSGEDQHGAPSRRLRSFARTRGRTRSRAERFDLSVETLVSVTVPGQAPPGQSLERRAILQLCEWQPLSVAEVSAYLDVPLGVTRVLLGDMADDGLLTIHRPTMTANQPPTLPLLQRVLAGLRSL